MFSGPARGSDAGATRTDAERAGIGDRRKADDEGLPPAWTGTLNIANKKKCNADRLDN